MGMSVGLKDREHEDERCPTRLRKLVALIFEGTWDSMRALSRMSLYTGLVWRRSKMEIWAGMFPRCSKILYQLFDGADGADETGGPTMLNRALRVVTTHSLSSPQILITLIEGSFLDIQPIRLP